MLETTRSKKKNSLSKKRKWFGDLAIIGGRQRQPIDDSDVDVVQLTVPPRTTSSESVRQCCSLKWEDPPASDGRPREHAVSFERCPSDVGFPSAELDVVRRSRLPRLTP